MNEFVNRRAPRVVAQNETVSPVPDADIADFLALPSADALLTAINAAAAGAVVSYLGRDLLTQTRTLTHWDWPVWGTMQYRSLGQMTGDYRDEILLPYAYDATVSSVTVYGEAFTDFINRGDAIVMRGQTRYQTTPEPAIVVEYETGFGALDNDVPQAIRHGVKSLAAYLYEHRGECDAQDGIQKSGAAMMLTPWRKAELLI